MFLPSGACPSSAGEPYGFFWLKCVDPVGITPTAHSVNSPSPVLVAGQKAGSQSLLLALEGSNMRSSCLKHPLWSPTPDHFILSILESYLGIFTYYKKLFILLWHLTLKSVSIKNSILAFSNVDMKCCIIFRRS